MSRFIIYLAVLLAVVNLPGSRGEEVSCQDVIKEIDDLNDELQECECNKDVYNSCEEALAANPGGAGETYIIIVDGVETPMVCWDTVPAIMSLLDLCQIH